MVKIVTVTPNPALDLTLEVDRLALGEVNIAGASRFESGGKGANVARMLARFGDGVVAVVALPADGADSWISGFPRDIELVAVRVAGALRANVAVTAADGETTKINMRGGPMSTADADSLLAAATAAARGAAWVVVGGSLPLGMDPSWIARAATAAREAGARFAVDCSGEALEAAVASGVDLIKPNEEEAARIVGFPIDDVASAERAAAQIVDRGVRSVLLSLGSRGAVFRSAESARTIHLPTPEARVRSTVGAGDVLLAVFLRKIADGAPPDVALRHGVAWAAAKVEEPGTSMPHAPKGHPEEGE